jgi:hypothetical protein
VNLAQTRAQIVGEATALVSSIDDFKTTTKLALPGQLSSFGSSTQFAEGIAAAFKNIAASVFARCKLFRITMVILNLMYFSSSF